MKIENLGQKYRLLRIKWRVFNTKPIREFHLMILGLFSFFIALLFEFLTGIPSPFNVLAGLILIIVSYIWYFTPKFFDAISHKTLPVKAMALLIISAFTTATTIYVEHIIVHLTHFEYHYFKWSIKILTVIYTIYLLPLTIAVLLILISMIHFIILQIIDVINHLFLQIIYLFKKPKNKKMHKGEDEDDEQYITKGIERSLSTIVNKSMKLLGPLAMYFFIIAMDKYSPLNVLDLSRWVIVKADHYPGHYCEGLEDKWIARLSGDVVSVATYDDNIGWTFEPQHCKSKLNTPTSGSIQHDGTVQQGIIHTAHRT